MGICKTGAAVFKPRSQELVDPDQAGHAAGNGFALQANAVSPSQGRLECNKVENQRSQEAKKGDQGSSCHGRRATVQRLARAGDYFGWGCLRFAMHAIEYVPVAVGQLCCCQ